LSKVEGSSGCDKETGTRLIGVDYAEGEKCFVLGRVISPFTRLSQGQRIIDAI